MDAILAWQVAVAVSIAVARGFSARGMVIVAICWTAFTFLAVWLHWLVLLQLITVWGMVWLLSKVWRETTTSGVSPQAKASSNLSTKTDRTDLEIEPLIKHLLATGKLNDDTRGSLLQFLADQRDGRLHPDDRAYVQALYDRTTSSSQSASEPGAEGQRSSRHSAHTPSAAPASPLRSLESFAKRMELAADQLHDAVQSAAETQKINADLKSQLYELRLHVDAAVKNGQTKIEIERRMAESPSFAEHYRRLEQTLAAREEGPPLTGLTLPPTPIDELPVKAAVQRKEWLKDVLAHVTAAQRHVKGDAALLAAINIEVKTSFETFLVNQAALLAAHIASLTPPTAKTEVPRRLSSGRAVLPEVVPPTRQPVFRSATNIIELALASTAVEDSPQADAVTAPNSLADIKRLASELGIPHLVHFTRCENLPTIFRHGLMSVSASARAGLSVARNDASRWDGQLDGTSLSIGFPNHSMFFKYRQLSADADWAVLLIAPQVLWEKDCAFYPHNAADGRMIRRPRDELKSAAALSDMFADGEGRPASLRPCDPTDPQAEVMVYEVVEPSLIEAVAFETAAAREQHRHLLEGRESFYAGAGKGLFAARHHTITN